MTQLYDPDLTQWLQHSGEFIGRLRAVALALDAGQLVLWALWTGR